MGVLIAKNGSFSPVFEEKNLPNLASDSRPGVDANDTGVLTKDTAATEIKLLRSPTNVLVVPPVALVYCPK